MNAPLPVQLKRSLCSALTGLMLLPASAVIVVPGESQAGGVAVRGPRGGGAAVRGPVNTGPVYGGPATVQGTARRTARRTTRRTARRLYTLPRGYTTRVVSGVKYYYVGGVYYRPYYEGNTVVYIEVDL